MENIDEENTTEHPTTEQQPEPEPSGERPSPRRGMTATYSCADNKLRLYSASRLDPETYQRVRDAGFRWAPKQELFFCPSWSPRAEDLLLDLCGEIDDEDTTPEERAEQRSERFEHYSENRAADAERAHAAVERIANGIPLGQPILVGHHSERHARKDAERIQNGMRKAVSAWQTSQYWIGRAHAARAHARFLERPDVRHRRIKTIEADKRKAEKNSAQAEKYIAAWTKVTTWEEARAIANHDHISHHYPLDEYPRTPICDDCDRPWNLGGPMEREQCGASRIVGKLAADGKTIERHAITCDGKQKPASSYGGDMGLWSALAGIITTEQARDSAIAAHERGSAYRARWIEHYTNRLQYERAMLDDGGGITAERFNIEPGGRVLIGSEWCTVIRVNRSAGKVSSLTTNRRYVNKVGIEEVSDYQPPAADEVAAVKKATTLPSLCNYPGEEFRHMTAAEYKSRYNAGIRIANTGGARRDPETHPSYAPHRLRCVYKGGPGLDCHNVIGVYLTDERTKFPPAADEQRAAEIEENAPPPPRVTPPEPDLPTLIERANRPQKPKPAPNKFDSMSETLRAGVQVVSADQLFPTPLELAARMVQLAQIAPGDRVLEPSAGTGNLLHFIKQQHDGRTIRVAVEINSALCQTLRQRDPGAYVHHADFIEWSAEPFDVIVMNPPFADAIDIRHIEHALTMLKPGGRLVALCAAGPRQRAKLLPIVEQHGGTWEDLPPDTFKTSGTSVNVAMLIIDAPPAAQPEEPIPQRQPKQQQMGLFT